MSDPIKPPGAVPMTEEEFGVALSLYGDTRCGDMHERQAYEHRADLVRHDDRQRSLIAELRREKRALELASNERLGIDPRIHEDLRRQLDAARARAEALERDVRRWTDRHDEMFAEREAAFEALRSAPEVPEREHFEPSAVRRYMAEYLVWFDGSRARALAEDNESTDRPGAPIAPPPPGEEAHCWRVGANVRQRPDKPCPECGDKSGHDTYGRTYPPPPGAGESVTREELASLLEEIADAFLRDEGKRRLAIKAPEDADVLCLCLAHGFGAVMDSAARLWRARDPVGAFTTGQCVKTVQNYAERTNELLDRLTTKPTTSGDSGDDTK